MMTRLIVNVSQVYVSYYVLDVLKLEKVFTLRDFNLSITLSGFVMLSC